MQARCGFNVGFDGERERMYRPTACFFNQIFGRRQSQAKLIGWIDRSGEPLLIMDLETIWGWIWIQMSGDWKGKGGVRERGYLPAVRPSPCLRAIESLVLGAVVPDVSLPIASSACPPLTPRPPPTRVRLLSQVGEHVPHQRPCLACISRHAPPLAPTASWVRHRCLVFLFE